MEAITRKVKPELAALIQKKNAERWEEIRKKLYSDSPVWRSLMDAVAQTDVEVE